MIRVIVLIGTRPEAIKMAPLIRELRSKQDVFHCCVVSSGQHREMVKQALSTFDLEVDVQCDAMSSAKSLGSLTARLFQDLDQVYEAEKPDWVLVQGDTNTAMAGALCAFYRRIKVGHVEAGLRTFDRFSPFPEEANRAIIGQVADLHFAPTQRAKENLLNAGNPESNVKVTGNTVVDALTWINSRMSEILPSELPKNLGDLIAEHQLILVTAHRRESFGAGLIRICDSVLSILKKHTNAVVLFPVHLNPKVRETVYERLSGHNRCILTEPLEYMSLLWLIKRATLILTDSGGIQEEAPSFATPIGILRDTTERPEVVEAGFGRLVGTDPERILVTVSAALESTAWRRSLKDLASPFGDGTACRRICTEIECFSRE